MKTDNLPEWATYDKGENVILVDPDIVYPLYLEKLGYDRKLITQAHLEVARKCFTQDLLQVTGPGLHLRISRTPEATWRLDRHIPGQPLDWRAEYKRISSAAA